MVERSEHNEKKKVVVLYTGLWSPYRPFGNADPSPIHKVDGLMGRKLCKFHI
jgi:hypothetical protein